MRRITRLLIEAIGIGLFIATLVIAINLGSRTARQQPAPAQPAHTDVLSTEQTIQPDMSVARPAQPAGMSAQDIMNDVNQERVKAGLPVLIVNAELNQSACLKADDMIAKNYWAHDAPDGTEPWHWFRVAGYRFAAAGENLGYGFTSADAQVTAWMNSAGHRKNILSSEFNDTGLCVKYGNFQGQTNTAVVVNHFGSIQ